MVEKSDAADFVCGQLAKWLTDKKSFLFLPDQLFQNLIESAASRRPILGFKYEGDGEIVRCWTIRDDDRPARIKGDDTPYEELARLFELSFSAESTFWMGVLVAADYVLPDAELPGLLLRGDLDPVAADRLRLSLQVRPLRNPLFPDPHSKVRFLA